VSTCSAKTGVSDFQCRIRDGGNETCRAPAMTSTGSNHIPGGAIVAPARGGVKVAQTLSGAALSTMEEAVIHASRNGETQVVWIQSGLVSATRCAADACGRAPSDRLRRGRRRQLLRAPFPSSAGNGGSVPVMW
jgi:hypothetical protein